MVHERAMSTRELALALSVSVGTVYALVADPAFPSFKVGSRYQCWPSEVRSYLSRPTDPWAPPTRRKVQDRTKRAHILPTTGEIVREPRKPK